MSFTKSTVFLALADRCISCQSCFHCAHVVGHWPSCRDFKRPATVLALPPLLRLEILGSDVSIGILKALPSAKRRPWSVKGVRLKSSDALLLAPLSQADELRAGLGTQFLDQFKRG